MELRQIAKDVYACLQEDRGLGTSNSGLINRGGGLVVDTFWDLPHTRRLIETYARVWKAPARRVVNTHHNGDHCWGNQLFSGAEIIGHRLCVESFFKEGSPEGFQMLLDMQDPPSGMAGFLDALRVFDFHGITLTPPTTIIDGDTTLTIGDTSAELLYLGFMVFIGISGTVTLLIGAVGISGDTSDNDEAAAVAGIAAAGLKADPGA